MGEESRVGLYASTKAKQSGMSGSSGEIGGGRDGGGGGGEKGGLICIWPPSVVGSNSRRRTSISASRSEIGEKGEKGGKLIIFM